jgi:hypothetical protein
MHISDPEDVQLTASVYFAHPQNSQATYSISTFSKYTDV